MPGARAGVACLCALAIFQSRARVSKAQSASRLTGALEEPGLDPFAPPVVEREEVPEPPVVDTAVAESPSGTATATTSGSGDNVTSSTSANMTPRDDESPAPIRIDPPQFPAIGSLYHDCGCANKEYDFEPDAKRVKKIRGFSDRYLEDGSSSHPDGWSNLVWALGQWFDHDLVATIDHTAGEHFDIKIKHRGQSAVMSLARLVVEEDGNGVCRNPVTATTPVMDAGQVYGNNEDYLKDVMREPTGCRLRTSPGELLPVTTDKIDGLNRFVAGDGRVNEHAILTASHTVWMREHNRLCAEIEADSQYDDLDDDAKFELARAVVRAKNQWIAVKHWLPLLGVSEKRLRNWKPNSDRADISVEFFITFRFGHDLIPDKMGQFRVADIFNGEHFFGITSNEGSEDPEQANKDMARLLRDAATHKAAALDGRFSDALRNTLFGEFGEDLSSRNSFRALEVGMADYADLAECYNVEPNRQVVLLGRGTKGASPVLALLKENSYVSSPFGDVNLAILTDQFHRILFGKEGMWWEDKEEEVRGFKDEIKATTLGKVFSANLDEDFADNVFKV